MSSSSAAKGNRSTVAAPEGGDGDIEGISRGDLNYVVDIKLFQSVPFERRLALRPLADFPEDRPLPAVLYQAARKALALTHAELSALAGVSKKTINDTENAFSLPSPRVAAKLRHIFEEMGCRFVSDGTRIGVMTTTTRKSLDERSRSQKVKDASRSSAA